MADQVQIPARFEIEVRDLEYHCHGDAPLLARLYRPTGSGPFPALIDVHGGAWASGDRLNNAPLDEALAKSGIVVLAIDFRMPPEHRYPASIADINLATRWLKAHDAYWRSEAEMEEGNPQLVLERGEAGTLPPAIVVQGLADDNVTPDMADRFAAAWHSRGGRLELHKFDGQPHTFIPRDPGSDASRRATELLRDFVLAQARA